MSDIKKITHGDAGNFLSEKLLSTEDVNRWFLLQLHQDGPKCPKCGVDITDQRRLDHWNRLERFKCRACDRFISSTENTILHAIKIDFRAIFLIGALTALGIQPKVIARITGASLSTVQAWQVKMADLPV